VAQHSPGSSSLVLFFHISFSISFRRHKALCGALFVVVCLYFGATIFAFLSKTSATSGQVEEGALESVEERLRRIETDASLLGEQLSSGRARVHDVEVAHFVCPSLPNLHCARAVVVELAGGVHFVARAQRHIGAADRVKHLRLLGIAHPDQLGSVLLLLFWPQLEQLLLLKRGPNAPLGSQAARSDFCPHHFGAKLVRVHAEPKGAQLDRRLASLPNLAPDLVLAPARRHLARRAQHQHPSSPLHRPVRLLGAAAQLQLKARVVRQLGRVHEGAVVAVVDLEHQEVDARPPAAHLEAHPWRQLQGWRVHGPRVQDLAAALGRANRSPLEAALPRLMLLVCVFLWATTRLVHGAAVPHEVGRVPLEDAGHLAAIH